MFTGGAKNKGQRVNFTIISNRMKIKELRKLDNAKLNEKLAELRNKTREFRFSIANNQLKKVRDLRVAKQDIAKILTVLNEKRLGKNVAPAKEEVSEEKK